jgi:hypothetical protein
MIGWVLSSWRETMAKCLSAMKWKYIRNFIYYRNEGRSRWPRRLRYKLPSHTPTLGSRVRNPLEAWMSVCVSCVSDILWVGSGLATDWSSPFKESYRLCIGLRNWKSGQGPKKVVEPLMNDWIGTKMRHNQLVTLAIVVSRSYFQYNCGIYMPGRNSDILT